MNTQTISDFMRGTTATSPFTILLVDDDEDCRLLIRDAIADCKVSNPIIEAGDGRAALELLDATAGTPQQPGLIYLDIEMPGMDGLQVLRWIRADDRYRDVPVVMMTGVADEKVMHEAALLGANSYTVKPSNAELFLKTVLSSTSYWLQIHQYPFNHLPQDFCRR